MLTRRHLALALSVAAICIACGESPLQGIGERSASWINEPEVTTTTIPVVSAPRFADVEAMKWSNDAIANDQLGDPVALVEEVFARRQGDRFIQASRYEIAAALPGLLFPSKVPYGAEWVSSQLVVESNGRLSSEPSAAFGVWSAEPYTRSRSVSQMVVLRVATDPVTAEEVSQPGAEISCARFADRTTEQCEITTVGAARVWRLRSQSGSTLIWFEGQYRYELFGRTFVPDDVLIDMAVDPIPLADLAVPPT
jgi:hypothetical protein